MALFSNRNQKSAQDRINELNELLKLNRGQGFLFAEDTGSSPGFLLPNTRALRNPNLSPFTSTQQPPQVPQFQPEVSTQPVGDPVQLPQPSGEVLGDNTQGLNSIVDFLNLYNQTGRQEGRDGRQSLMRQHIDRYNPSSIEDRTYQEPNSEIYGRTSYDPQTGRMVRYSPEMQRGLQGLQQLFPTPSPITQAYGNYNPAIEPGSGYNLGTDFGVNQVPINLPLSGEVVEIFTDDGTQWGETSGHQGYGNSVLIRLDSGEYLRFSHLSEIGDVQIGQRIVPGTYIGTTGATGNVTGPHLDLEYYNADGQIDTPENFSGFRVEPDPVPSQRDVQQPRETRVEQPQPQVVPQQITEAVSSAPRQISEATTNIGRGIQNQAQQTGRVLGTAIDQNQPLRRATGGLGLGISENLQGDVLGAQTERARTSAAIERAQPTGQNIDFGASELLRGDTEGAQRIFQQTIGRIKDRLGQVAQNTAESIVPGAFSSATDPGDRRDVGERSNPGVIAQAGEGIKSLANRFIPGVFGKPSPADIGSKKAVGEETGTSGGSVLGVASTPQSAGQAAQKEVDLRDPFFRSGQVNQFKGFLNPGAESGQALTTDIFRPDFFQDRERVQQVFGGTHLAGDAADIADEEQRKLEASRQPKPTLQDYLSRGKTAEQYYAETGQQSVADSFGGARNAARAERQARSEDQRKRDAGTQQAQQIAQEVSGSRNSLLSQKVSEIRPHTVRTEQYDEPNSEVYARTSRPKSDPGNLTIKKPRRSLFQRITNNFNKLFGR